MNINEIIKNDLCTGCGVCISEDSKKDSKMDWNEYGFLVPNIGKEADTKSMYDICPFKIDQYNEDFLGEKFTKHSESIFNQKIGYYQDLSIGYSHKFRKSSSSGGLATYVFEYLISNNIVDYLFIVTSSENGYKYKLVDRNTEITSISKTRYTPVTLEKLFLIIDDLDGKIAVSGVACFLKAIRLKQLKHPHLVDKIPFLVGIVCGGLKSRFYTDYLAQEANCFDEYDEVEYRIKKPESYALDYKFQCRSKSENRIHMVEMRSLGDMWGTGLFKSNACDFCDDVLTELADISLGDAWIEPYSKEGLGNSIVIVRSLLAKNIINKGVENKDLKLVSVKEDDIIKSQSGSFNHRHDGLKFRIGYRKKSNLIFPKKRARFLVNKGIVFNMVQANRMKIRKFSLEQWKKSSNVSVFRGAILPLRIRLNRLTKINHKLNQLKKLIARFLK